jgi:hypothetical protein
VSRRFYNLININLFGKKRKLFFPVVFGGLTLPRKPTALQIELVHRHPVFEPRLLVETTNKYRCVHPALEVTP